MLPLQLCWSLSRNYFKGVDLAMNTTTRNMLAVPVLSRSHGKDEGKVIAVRLGLANSKQLRSICLVLAHFTWGSVREARKAPYKALLMFDLKWEIKK